jgi:hypothetical protein
LEHLLEGIPGIDNIPLLRGYIFGVVHAGLIIMGYYFGWSINRFLKLLSNGFVAGILGATKPLDSNFRNRLMLQPK